MKNVDEFTLGYIECALWSSTDESDESGGNPMDDDYSIDDIAECAIDEIIIACEEFQKENAELLTEYCKKRKEFCEKLGFSANACAGHDFWLTRNGHGAGFWDRGLGELGDKLSEASKACGESNLYVGDDGLIYVC